MRNAFTGLLSLLFVCGVFELARATDFTVGTATAKLGQKITGFLQVPAGIDPATEIPVALINGAKPGPTLALVAGSHGTEYASIVALQKMIQTVDPADISGVLIIVPLVNTGSFVQKVPHLNPADGKNMNRFYPGKADGTQTERALWAITKQIVERCDYLIDFHGGDIDENLLPYSYWPKTGNSSLDTVTRGMVLAFGLDHIIIETDRPTDPNHSRYLDTTAITRGKAAITVEAGRAGTTHAEDIDALIRGSLDVMRYLKMLTGAAAPLEHPVWVGNISMLTSDRDGVFYALVEPQMYVERGMRIGYLTDFFGSKVEDVTAPVSGIVLFVGAVPSMKKGDNISYIGEIAKAP
jgi:predicted deacylase